jgi:DNA-binding CsgD family transcriptional regulator
MVYERETELCLRLRAAGLTSRDCANALGLSPARARAKLGGFELLTAGERLKLIALCGEATTGQGGDR